MFARTLAIFASLCVPVLVGCIADPPNLPPSSAPQVSPTSAPQLPSTSAPTAVAPTTPAVAETEGSKPAEPTSPDAVPTAPIRTDEEILQEGLRREDAAFRSSDDTAWRKEYDETVIDKGLFEKLFGTGLDDVWEQYQSGLTKRLETAPKHREHLRKVGPLTRIQLVEIREEDPRFVNKSLLALLPADRKFYKIVLHFEEGGAGGDYCLVDDGRMRSLPNLSELATLIAERRGQQP